MATDEPTTQNEDQDDQTNDAPEGDDEPLREPGKRALVAERQRASEAEKLVKELQSKLQEREDAELSELEKLQRENASYKEQLTSLEQKAIRAEIAAEKGLSPAQAKRLVGASREELEADADELLETFGSSKSAAPAAGRPRERLSGGTTPDDEPAELDPRKLAALIMDK